MLDAFKYCERLLRENDKDRFLASLFAPATHRPALLSLYAFEVEIAQVAGRVKEPLAGEIRLQWWRDAVSGAVPEQVAGNPVAAAFVETVRAFRLPLETIVSIIDAESGGLYGSDAPGNEPAQGNAAGVFALAARILNDGVDPGINDLTSHAGRATALVNAGQSNAETTAHFDAVRAQLACCPDSVLPAFLPLALIRARLDLVRRTGDASADLPQWRKQWILWRASKNLGAWV
jgi:phytoene synthase